MILGGSGRNLNYSGKFQYSHRILTVIRMTAQNLIQLCSSFCRKMMCMLGSKTTLHFERSDLVISLGKEILGEGGFSTVYKASDRKLSINAHYAVKKVLILNNEIKRSVIAEIEALNQFCHVNIIRLIDSTEGRNDSNMPVMYLLFPLLQRGTLRDILNSRLKIDPARVSLSLAPLIKDIVSILSAFNYMHTFSPVKYIHQDIKPEVSNQHQSLINYGAHQKNTLCQLFMRTAVLLNSY